MVVMTDKDIEDAVDRLLEDGWPGLREQANGLMLRIDWLTDTECSTHPQTVSNSGVAPASYPGADDQSGRERRHSDTTDGSAPETRLDDLVGDALAVGNAGAGLGDERIGPKLAFHFACRLLSAHFGNTGAKLAEALMPLYRALDELDHGVTHPMFTPCARGPGRPQDSARIQLFKLRCILLGDALVANGTRASKANEEVASCASAMADRLFGTRPSYSFDAETVRRWRKDFAARRKADEGSRGEREFSEEDAAVMAYDLATFTGKLPEFARKLRRSLEPANFEMPVG